MRMATKLATPPTSPAQRRPRSAIAGRSGSWLPAARAAVATTPTMQPMPATRSGMNTALPSDSAASASVS